MALIPVRPRQEHARNDRGPADDSTPSGASGPRSFGLSWPADRSESEPSGAATPIDSLLDEFSSRWQRGESPSIEEYLALLGPAPTSDAALLIYHAYCLAEATGQAPDRAEFIERFPDQGPSLERLFSRHRAFDPAQRSRGGDGTILPEVGDEIGPYRLLRELGKGGLARVFLAEQSDLDCRLVVVKVSARITPEPRLLARARHAHIVEVLWHSQTEDGAFQVVCMPFLGGATLADVLADRRRRGGRPKSGRALLAELDRASAAEYPRADLLRPSREIIAGLSYPRAVAWVVARLAEALDFAYSRGVLHGDVKPSNILLTAAGEPMLLDFNLAVGWRLPAGSDLPGDVGGTLAYMAPERLRAIAQPGQAAAAKAADRHRADLYALGMVLLEALADRTPDHPRGSPRNPRETAAALARSREQGAATLIRSCRVSIPAGLRSILNRCLAPEPADRYNRASELAEDLDRWVRDRPLAFAPEPNRLVGMVRWTRRRRLAVAAGALSVAVAVVSAMVVSRISQSSLKESALSRLARLWDDTESKAFTFRRPGEWRHVELTPPEDAFRRLAYYNVLGAADWRTRDEFRALPEWERADLEIWILEQSFHLSRVLGRRTDAPRDWQRALEVLERVVTLRPLGALEAQRQVLRGKLGLALPEANTPTSLANPPPHWMEEYMLGVEAEARRVRDALSHFRNVLKERPNSFWAHQRAAALACRVGDREAAVKHLEYCIRRRPENASLRAQLGGCLSHMGRFDLALEQCDKALTLDPDHVEAYRTRTLIRSRLGQADGVRADLQQYEVLTRHRGKLPALQLRLESMLTQSPDEGGSLDTDSPGANLPQRLLTADPDDVDLRTTVAKRLQKEGRAEAALAEYDQVLETNPGHLLARYYRAGLLFERHQGLAHNDFAFLLVHPRFEEFLADSTVGLQAFYCDSSELLQKGAHDQALQVALRGLTYAKQYNDRMMQGRMHYALARVYARGAESAPEQLQQSATHLRIASQYDREYLGNKWFSGDRFFANRREQIAVLISRIADDAD